MTLTLRKIHRYAWFSLAFLLPLAWLAAIWVLPETIWQDPVRKEQTPALPLLVQSKETGDFVLNLRQDPQSGLGQIEVYIKKPLANPNTLVIMDAVDSSKALKERLLGLLGSRGVYRFNLDTLSAFRPEITIRLEDKIQGRVLRTVVFKY